MRDLGTRPPNETSAHDAALGASQALIYAPPPTAYAHPSEVTVGISCAPQSPSLQSLPQPALFCAPELPMGRTLSPLSGQRPSVLRDPCAPEILAKVAQILRLDKLHSMAPYPYNPNIKASHAIAFLPSLARTLGDAVQLERLAQTISLLEGRDSHPLSRLLMLYRLGSIPKALREAVVLFAPMLFRQLTSVLERAALLSLFEQRVHAHDVEDFCRIVLLFGDAPTAYRGATALYQAQSIDALVALMAHDADAAQITTAAVPALVHAADVAAISPVLWPDLEQALQMLKSIDGVLVMPPELSAWFVRNRDAANDWDKVSHKVAQTCYRLQHTPGRGRLTSTQMSQRLLDFVEALGGDTMDPAEDPVPPYTSELSTP